VAVPLHRVAFVRSRQSDLLSVHARNKKPEDHSKPETVAPIDITAKQRASGLSMAMCNSIFWTSLGHSFGTRETVEDSCLTIS